MEGHFDGSFLLSFSLIYRKKYPQRILSHIFGDNHSNYYCKIYNAVNFFHKRTHYGFRALSFYLNRYNTQWERFGTRWKPNPIGIKNHFFVIQNGLSNTVTVTNIHKTNVVWNTRGTVTIVLYRRWSVNAGSRSIDTAAKMTKETPVVVQPDRNWTIFNSQNTAKFSSSSAIYELHKVVDIPGRQGGQRPPGINGGEWSSWVFPIVKTIRKFPKHVTRENRQFRLHVTIFAVKTPSVLSKLTYLSSKKKQFFPVWFMANIASCQQIRRSCWKVALSQLNIDPNLSLPLHWVRIRLVVFLSVSLKLCWSLEIVSGKYRSFFNYLKQIFIFSFNI